ncbi:MAG: hypothetical protein ACI8YC_000969, partial [Salibacteraceae bacterium]
GSLKALSPTSTDVILSSDIFIAKLSHNYLYKSACNM